VDFCPLLVTIHQSHVFRRTNGVVVVTKKCAESKNGVGGGDRTHYINIKLPGGLIWGNDVGSDW